MARTVLPVGDRLLELVNARLNGAGVAATARLFATLAAFEPCSFELALAGDRRAFLARAATGAMARQIAAGFAAVYPQGEVRPREVARDPGLDPARLAAGEQAVAAVLGWRGGTHLPIRTFADDELDPERGARADPLLAILNAGGDLPRGWRILIQHVLRPAPPGWDRGYARKALQQPLAEERPAARGGDAGADTTRQLLFWALLGGAGVAAWHGYGWYAARDWLHLALLGGGLGLALPATALGYRWLTHTEPFDPALVQEKLSYTAFAAQVRLSIIGPAGVERRALVNRLRQVVNAYGQYTLPAGNGFVPRELRLPAPTPALPHPLTVVAPLGGPTGILNAREVAGLWHLPQTGSDVPFVERTGARRRLPLPADVADGCRIGVSERHGTPVVVHAGDPLLAEQNTLAVAKTRAGKSTLFLRFFRYLAEDPPGCLLVLDPQHDLAWDCLGAVPREQEARVVYLDAGNRERPFGLNLLDAGLGWDRDKAVANTLQVFQREFDDFWGPRMADAFRFAAQAVCEANEALCRLDPVGGRARQYTVLDLPALFINKAFRKDVLALVDDREVKDWWNHHWEVSLDPRLRMETSNPVVTKINKFKASWAARMVIGQPASTIDPRAWLRDRAIVVVDLASGLIGEDTAALLGGTILNYLKETIAAQQGTPRGLRDRVTLLVDEFHMIPGADYEGLLSGQAKSGANLHLATQSLARLDMETRDGTRALRKIVFDNIRGCFAFHTSAENAAYLVPELGGESEVDVEDLVGLSDYHCYARLSRGERRLPAFLVALDPPPVVDPHRAARLAAASAERWGRARADVLADRQFALDRIEAASAAERLERKRREEAERGKKGGSGTSNRNQNRRRDGAQKSLFDLAPGAGAGWSAEDRRGDNGEEANE